MFFWASKFADWGPAASRAPGRTTDNPMGRCALRRAILCPIYFNQHVSALLAESLHPPCLSRNRSTLQIAAHDGSPASWSSPWREHGHSDEADRVSPKEQFLGVHPKIGCIARIWPRKSLLGQLREAIWAEDSPRKPAPHAVRAAMHEIGAAA